MTGNPPLRLAVAAMGTRFELALLAGTGDLRTAGEAAIDEIVSWHRRLSRFAPDSLVSHIKREAFQRPVRLDRDTFELLQDAMDVWRSTGGAFDITVGPASQDGGQACPPAPGRGWSSLGEALRLDAERWTIAFAVPGMSLDLGGIAKGHALDCAARVLREAGVTAALLHGGTSSIVAIGAPEGSGGWRVAVGAEDGRRTLSLEDCAFSVSDPRGAEDGRRVGPHIVDPRSGAAVSAPRRATVIGPSARLADAWSTALVVLGYVPATFPQRYYPSLDVHEPALS